ncbi:MAG TPA: N-acetylglucosamine-6-phosphate deacetylase [Flavisolibacter sp.]
MQRTIVPAAIFTGSSWLQEHAVVVENGVVRALVPAGETTSDAEHYPAAILAPAFIDAQVYGAAGKLLASYPEASTLQVMERAYRNQGTCRFQPTVATNTLEVFRACIDAVRAYRSLGGTAVHGLHLEGPWINPRRRGAHLEHLIRVPGRDEVGDLLEYGRGVISMITLAPEVCTDDILELILSYGIVISAGHSDATFDQAMHAFEQGVAAVTHLFNAMSPFHHRAPGLTGAALAHQRIHASIIPDGHHVDYHAISIAQKVLEDRLFAITDAVTESHTGPYRHQREDGKFVFDGTLSGSAISMADALYNLVHRAGVPREAAMNMCSLYPARVLGIDKTYGKIAPGYQGQFILLDKQLKLEEVLF